MNPIPWYQSPVQMRIVASVVAGLLSLFPSIGNLLGIETPDKVDHAVEVIFGTISLAMVAWAGHKRATSPIQPLTLTKASAESQTTPAGEMATNVVKNAVKDAPK